MGFQTIAYECFDYFGELHGPARIEQRLLHRLHLRQVAEAVRLDLRKSRRMQFILAQDVLLSLQQGF